MDAFSKTDLSPGWALRGQYTKVASSQPAADKWNLQSSKPIYRLLIAV